MKKSLLFILLLIGSISVNSQTFTEIYRGDYYKIIGISNARNNTLNIYKNYDEDNLFIKSYGYPSDTDSYFLIDDALNVIKQYEFHKSFIEPDFCILNNKIYSFRGDIVWGNYYYYQDMWLLMYDSIENRLHKDTIMRFDDDTLKWTDLKKWLLSDRNIMISLESYPKSQQDGSSQATKLIKIDTLGNVLNTKIFYHKSLTVDFGEMPNHYMYAINGSTIGWEEMQEHCAVYYLNKETLEIEDSIKGYDVRQLTPINDSLFVFTFFGGSGYLTFDSMSVFTLMNINTKRITPVQSRKPGGYGEPPFFQTYSDYSLIDFRTPDSIYAAYIVRNSFSDYTDANIGFTNFNINGDTNFTYKIDYDNGIYKQIQGVKATKDGGVIIAAYSDDDDAWLIKFKPTGLISLTSIKSGDKESIKVYPNPAKDYIYVDIEASNFKQSDIELFDMQGKLVKKAKLKSKLENRINVSNLNAGAYTYNVSVNGKTISGKIIVGKVGL
ncbi:MAG: T9SS type A sorting domain-containing protein [Bacteroidales bacterium]|nr:T9SS type A sorting domain-containing protein [Bacteroidales bacterium]MDD4683967.1 T9SS type A sorting domain-containing protein [Bacteroidales bacterium]